MSHEPIITRLAPAGGAQTIYRFPNGYGASVVVGGYAYGGRELAVLRFAGDSDKFYLTFDTPITGDVIGWLDSTDVPPLLEIAALPDAAA